MKREIEPIAIISTPFTDKFGIPRQSGRVSTQGKITFLPKYRSAEALRELDSFSHIWLIFGFSENQEKDFTPTVRPPRLGGNKKVGVFASRSPFRPNGLGLSLVELKKIEYTKQGPILTVEGADLLDKTPIYDIKPYLTFCDSKPDARCGYASEHKDHKLLVKCKFDPHSFDGKLISTITQIIAQDPRPSYQNDSRVYKMDFDGYKVEFSVLDNTAEILSITKN